MLKNSFWSVVCQKLARKLLNVRPPQKVNFIEITALVLFQQPRLFTATDSVLALATVEKEAPKAVHESMCVRTCLASRQSTTFQCCRVLPLAKDARALDNSCTIRSEMRRRLRPSHTEQIEEDRQ
jgi:hypothetical protein